MRENDFDPTTWSDDELEKVARSLGHTSGRSMPQAWQRNKVTNELKRRADARRDKKPAAKPKSNVDQNLEASAKPIAVESVAGREPGWSVRGRPMRQEQIDRLVEAGDDPETAARVVDSMAEIHGGQIQPGLFDAYNTPQGNEALRSRIAEGKRANARQAAFETEYNAATGNPEYGYDEAGNPARLGRVDIDNPSEAELRARGERAYNARDPRGAEAMAAGGEIGSDYAPSTPKPQYADMTVPGPRTLDGRAPTPSRGLTAEEAEAYNRRPPGGLSQRDRDMMARGYVPVVTADGVSYRPEAVPADNKYAIPGGPGRRGPRPDLEGKYVMDSAVGPDGQVRAVLVPDPEWKAKNDAVLKERRQRLGAERTAALKRWQAIAQLAGGSQNLNAGNRWIANALVDLPPEEQRQRLAEMMPMDPNRAKVEAANAEHAAQLAARAIQGALLGQAQSPQAAAANEQRQMENRAAQMAWAEQHINDNYAYDSGLFSSTFGTDEFTDLEYESAVQDVRTQFRISEAEAREIVDSIARRKRRAKPGAAPAQSTGPGGLPAPAGSTPYRYGA